MPDLLGAGVLAVAIGALAYGIVTAPDHGWGSAPILCALGLAVVSSALFWRRSQQHPMPVVEPALLRVRSFAWANATALLFNLAFAANLLANILWLQRVWHYASTRTGLAVAPGPLMVPIFALVAQIASRRGVSAGRIAAAGCALCAVGAGLVLGSVSAEPAFALEVLPGWLVSGAGVGLAMPTILSAAAVDLPRERSATGSAIINMSRQVGAVLGVSVLVAVMGDPRGFADTQQAFRRVWLVVVVMSLAAAAAAIGMRPASERARS